MSTFTFTSESVSEGHPDKICDQISDAILDTYLAAAPEARVAVETMATTNRVVLAGEVRGPDSITPAVIEEKVRQTVKDIGYAQKGFHWKNLTVHNYLHEQSADIAVGVDEAAEKAEGAGDQGIMFGHAIDETPALMPAPIYYSHKILESLTNARKAEEGLAAGLGPDAKSQVSVQYVKDKPQFATSVVVSIQHLDGMSNADIETVVKEHIEESLPEGWIRPETVLHINPTGRFVIGGPDGDAGLTGRKIIVDTYGGAAPHGGGAFSGKDPTKVDRSAAYICRYLAKNLVAAGVAKRCTIQLSYAIGVAEPLSVYLNFHDTTSIREEVVARRLGELIDLTPKGIRTRLQLNRPIYQPTAAYGHFGREAKDGLFPWEATDLAEEFRKEFL